jgi:hypothetical protein
MHRRTIRPPHYLAQPQILEEPMGWVLNSTERPGASSRPVPLPWSGPHPGRLKPFELPPYVLAQQHAVELLASRE